MPTDAPEVSVPPADDATERVFAKLYEEQDSFQVTLGVAAGACVVAYAVQKVLEYSSRAHWIVAAALSLAIAFAFAWITRKTRRSRLASTRASCVASVWFGLMLGVVVAGWASYTLHSLGLAMYRVTPAPSLEAFMRLYFFTVADLIPAIRVAETLHLQSPVEAQDFVAGLPVLAFRVFVIWFLFDAFKTWRNGRKDEGKEKSSDTALFVLFFLLFVASALWNLK